MTNINSLFPQLNEQKTVQSWECMNKLVQFIVNNFYFTVRELLQISEGQISDCSEVISETQVQLFQWSRKINTDHRNEWYRDFR